MSRLQAYPRRVISLPELGVLAWDVVYEYVELKLSLWEP
jgi:hypothetical protein